MKPKTSLLYDVFVLYQSVGVMLGRALSKAPLGPEEYAIYSHIFEYDGCTPSEMSRDLHMPLQTVSDWLALLRKREHLSSVINDRDRRSYRVSLTSEGRALHQQTSRHFDLVNRIFLKALPRSETEMRSYVDEMIGAARTAAAGLEARALPRVG